MPQKETIIHFSANESNLLHLKVGRCVSTRFDEKAVLHQILEEEYDICRLTVSSGDEDAVTKLERTGLPYFYSGSITRYKTAIAELQENEFIHPDIVYENYDGTQNDLLLQLLIGTWGTYPIGYYRSPFLNKLVTKEQEIIAVCEFYKKHNLQTDFPNNTIMFMKHNDNYVGFFALNIIEDRLESHIGGIIEPYRKDGYFFDMQEYIRRFCIQNKLRYFVFGARNENRRVNEIFQKYGYKAVDADNVFHIASLLNHTTSGKKIHSSIKITDDEYSVVYSQLFEECKKNLLSTTGSMLANTSFKINNLTNLNKDNYELICTFPVVTSNEIMMSIKICNTENKLVSFGYLYMI